ncbi:MAG TPA: 2-oxo acid dehydrogenase subunit E2 [Solirubrobacterales bacterium]|nr:2-oxo acid dehydrogenase subunit E2 [Solirubrobacterales bacterium]
MAEGALAEQPGRGEAEPVKLSLMRRAMARRMSEAALVPCFYLRVTADAAPAMAARARLAEEAGDGPRPTLNDYLLVAVGRALAAHPEVNASYDEDGVTRHPRVNVGVAISVPDGLVVPAVYDADRKGLAEVATATRELAAAAAERRLGRDVLSDATFTVSNLGMFGIEDFDPVLNPPQAAILGVGAAAPADAEGRRALRLTLGCDHRVLTGTEGARFLGTVKDELERAGA